MDLRGLFVVDIGAGVLVLDVSVHAADSAKLLAADHAHGFTRVVLLMVVPGT